MVLMLFAIKWPISTKYLLNSSAISSGFAISVLSTFILVEGEETERFEGVTELINFQSSYFSFL